MHKNEFKTNSISKEEYEMAVLESNSFPEVCIKLGLNPKIGNIKSNVERKIKRLLISTTHFNSVKRISKERWDKNIITLLCKKYNTYKEILLELDLLPISSNYRSLKKFINDNKIKFRISKGYKLSESELNKIISESHSYSECLEKIKIRSAGGNFNTIKKYIKKYDIDISHFNIKNDFKPKRELIDILVKDSSFSRSSLKRRLLGEKILVPICCLCGQDENWKGVKISLILDHINGIYNDNRIKNLRIVCPNCNAGLDTFAGRNNKKVKNQCSCGNKINKFSKKCNKCNYIERRKVERPSYENLIKEVDELGFSTTGRKYGVSDTTIKKWILSYQS